MVMVALFPVLGLLWLLVAAAALLWLIAFGRSLLRATADEQRRSAWTRSRPPTAAMDEELQSLLPRQPTNTAQPPRLPRR